MYAHIPEIGKNGVPFFFLCCTGTPIDVLVQCSRAVLLDVIKLLLQRFFNCSILSY